MNNLTKKVQVKFNQYCMRMQGSFSKPKVKFIKEMMFGILKSGKVQLNSIARALEEKTTIKKTSERLGRNLKEKGLDKLINKELSRSYSRKLNKSDSYLILDLSDLAKPKAEKMEGLSLVRDGSLSGKGESKLVNGYYLCNVIGRLPQEENIYPLYSELYSIKEEITSENQRILEAMKTVNKNIPKGIWVLDRGGDRETIITPSLKAGYRFIIRQTGLRNLNYNGKELPFIEIAKKVKLRYTIKAGKRNLKCGAVRVKYKDIDKKLWLVVSKYKNGGYFYLLCHLPEVFNAKTAVKQAIEGYSLRWSIEEVHRHIKCDFDLEDVRLLTYQSLKNLMPILWTAISFLYIQISSISLELIVKSKLKVLIREKFSEIKGFIYYKVYKALKFILHNVNIRKIELYKGVFNKKKQLILQF